MHCIEHAVTQMWQTSIVPLPVIDFGFQTRMAQHCLSLRLLLQHLNSVAT